MTVTNEFWVLREANRATCRYCGTNEVFWATLTNGSPGLIEWEPIEADDARKHKSYELQVRGDSRGRHIRAWWKPGRGTHVRHECREVRLGGRLNAHMDGHRELVDSHSE